MCVTCDRHHFKKAALWIVFCLSNTQRGFPAFGRKQRWQSSFSSPLFWWSDICLRFDWGRSSKAVSCVAADPGCNCADVSVLGAERHARSLFTNEILPSFGYEPVDVTWCKTFIPSKINSKDGRTKKKKTEITSLTTAYEYWNCVRSLPAFFFKNICARIRLSVFADSLEATCWLDVWSWGSVVFC